MTWAFSDESERANLMLFGLLLIPPGELATARRELSTMLLPRQRRIHTSDESARRRRAWLDLVGELDVRVIVLSLRRHIGLNRVDARDALLGAAVEVIEEYDVASWVLDDQHPHQADRDRRVIEAVVTRRNVSVVYDHRGSAYEPLLWAVDGVLWAVGAGGDWRRRVDRLVDVRTVAP